MSNPCQACGARANLFLCTACTSQLRDALASLVTGPGPGRTAGLLEDLDDVRLRRTKLAVSSGHRQRGDEQPGPFEPDTTEGRRTKQGEAAILLDALRNGLTTIVRDLCETRGVTVTVSDNTAHMAAWLAQHANAIAADPSAGHVHNEIHTYVRRIHRCIDRPARRIWLGPCPTWDEDTRRACGTDLRAPEDAIEVYCRTCRTTHNTNRLKLLQQNDLDRELLTWDRVLNANRYQPDDYRIPERTLRVWRKTGKLKPRGWLRPNGRHGGTQHGTDDQPLYRWSDIRRLRAERPHHGATGAAARK